MRTMTLKIEGMGCSGCVNSVEQALLEVQYVESVNVDLDSGIAKIIYRENEPDLQEMVQAVEDAGYAASKA